MSALIAVSQPAAHFFKEEGGKSNVLTFTVRAPGPLPLNRLPLSVSVVYESGAPVDDAAEVLTLVKAAADATTDYVLTATKNEATILFRLEKVTRRCPEPFRLAVEPVYPQGWAGERWSGVMSESVTVLSKRKPGERVVSRRVGSGGVIPGGAVAMGVVGAGAGGDRDAEDDDLAVLAAASTHETGRAGSVTGSVTSSAAAGAAGVASPAPLSAAAGAAGADYDATSGSSGGVTAVKLIYSTLLAVQQSVDTLAAAVRSQDERLRSLESLVRSAVAPSAGAAAGAASAPAPALAQQPPAARGRPAAAAPAAAAGGASGGSGGSGPAGATTIPPSLSMLGRSAAGGGVNTAAARPVGASIPAPAPAILPGALSGAGQQGGSGGDSASRVHRSLTEMLYPTMGGHPGAGAEAGRAAADGSASAGTAGAAAIAAAAAFGPAFGRGLTDGAGSLRMMPTIGATLGGNGATLGGSSWAGQGAGASASSSVAAALERVRAHLPANATAQLEGRVRRTTDLVVSWAAAGAGAGAGSNGGDGLDGGDGPAAAKRARVTVVEEEDQLEGGAQLLTLVTDDAELAQLAGLEHHQPAPALDSVQ